MDYVDPGPWTMDYLLIPLITNPTNH